MLMNDNSRRVDIASAVEVEAKRFGRVLSEPRAMEIAAELERYEAAMERLRVPQILQCDAAGFIQALVDLAATRR